MAKVYTEFKVLATARALKDAGWNCGVKLAKSHEKLRQQVNSLRLQSMSYRWFRDH
jgi:hypothetical protein